MSGSDVKGQSRDEVSSLNRTSDLLGPVEKTSRGFHIIRFEDRNEQKCSLQMSSLADFRQPGASAIWLGVGDHRMHLDLVRVCQLHAALGNWIKHSVFAVEKPLEKEPSGKEEFPELSSGGNRPVTWQYQLDTVEGHAIPTNSVSIFSRPIFEYDESGENGDEKFAVVYLTRAEIAEILKTLEEDIAEMRKYCPGHEFE